MSLSFSHVLKGSWVPLRDLLRESVQVARRRRWAVSAVLVGGVMGGVWVAGHDSVWLEAIFNARTLPRDTWARGLHVWGDYFPGSVGVAAILGALGWGMKRPQWRKAAVACLLASSLAGIGTNVIKAGVGRPRPRTELPDQLQGPTFSWRLHSFPSGHTSTAFGSAATLAVAVPAVGVPLLGVAGAVGWSRVYDRWHYPSDVWAGALIGCLVGGIIGMACRRQNEREGPA